MIESTAQLRASRIIGKRMDGLQGRMNVTVSLCGMGFTREFANDRGIFFMSRLKDIYVE
jgi:hypothetical protein